MTAVRTPARGARRRRPAPSGGGAPPSARTSRRAACSRRASRRGPARPIVGGRCRVSVAPGRSRSAATADVHRSATMRVTSVCTRRYSPAAVFLRRAPGAMALSCSFLRIHRVTACSTAHGSRSVPNSLCSLSSSQVPDRSPRRVTRASEARSFRSPVTRPQAASTSAHSRRARPHSRKTWGTVASCDRWSQWHLAASPVRPRAGPVQRPSTATA